jgi:hypothetical protein
MRKISYTGLEKIENLVEVMRFDLFSNESEITKKLNEVINKVNILIELKNSEVNN